MNHLRENHHVLQVSGLLLGFSLYFYRVRELLFSWLFFSAVFACVMLVILGGLLAVHAGEWLTVWARTTAPVTPVLALVSAEIPLEIIPDATEPK